jgi:hypothetical protein
MTEEKFAVLVVKIWRLLEARKLQRAALKRLIKSHPELFDAKSIIPAQKELDALCRKLAA